MLPFVVTLPAQPAGVPHRLRSTHPRQNFLTPFFIAFPYVSAVSHLSTAFTHFDRGGRVSGLRRPRSLRTSISNPRVSRHLQIALSGTPLFSHLSVSPGVSPDSSFTFATRHFSPVFITLRAALPQLFSFHNHLRCRGWHQIDVNRRAFFVFHSYESPITSHCFHVLSQRASYSQAAKPGKGGVPHRLRSDDAGIGVSDGSAGLSEPKRRASLPARRRRTPCLTIRMCLGQSRGNLRRRGESRGKSSSQPSRQAA